MKRGDTVQCTPNNPFAIGCGIGVLTHVGTLLVRVKFPQWQYPVACRKTDVKVIKEKGKD